MDHPQYLQRLIGTVDIGKHYPMLLKDQLILDPLESTRRRQLFVEQMSVQLPMQAFEYMVRGLGGLTASGYRVMQAIMQADSTLRVVDGETIVARHLAFLEHAGGSVHRAFNLFVIGPRDNSPLPHILYHPQVPLHSGNSPIARHCWMRSCARAANCRRPSSTA